MWWLETLELKNLEMLSILDTQKEYLLKFKLSSNLKTEDRSLNKKDQEIKPQLTSLMLDTYLL